MIRGFFHRAGVVARRRAEQGWNRVREAALPVTEAAIAACAAWEFARLVLQHPAPFFAPVAAWVCLGFSRDRDVRLVGELAIGVSLGVAFGDLAVMLFGHGPVQLGAIL
ncbi:MAG: FUSC family protein, partial [Bifidobacteriaceae bacterium]|nr:FUSC family protein [Bifidobacteriaceae bacterium]